VFSYPKPLLPYVIEVHSLQISEELEPLSEVRRKCTFFAKSDIYYSKISVILVLFYVIREKVSNYLISGK